MALVTLIAQPAVSAVAALTTRVALDRNSFQSRVLVDDLGDLTEKAVGLGENLRLVEFELNLLVDDDLVVFDVEGGLAADAAIGAQAVDRAVGLAP